MGKVVLLAAVASAAPPKGTYVPIPCMSRFVIHDFGKCTLTGDRYHCPAADLEFSIGCTSTKPGTSTGTLKIERPAAAIVENSQ